METLGGASRSLQDDLCPKLVSSPHARLHRQRTRRASTSTAGCLSKPSTSAALPTLHFTYRSPQCVPRQPNERRTTRPEQLQQPRQPSSQRHLLWQAASPAACAEPPLPTPHERARFLRGLISRESDDSQNGLHCIGGLCRRQLALGQQPGSFQAELRRCER